ncbi:MAG: ABC transporter permease YtrF [Anaerolineales bacterium]
MRWQDLLYLIRQNLWRMKLRVAMTAIGVLIGTTSIILLVALGSGLQSAATQDIGSFGDLTEITVYNNASDFMAVGPADLARPQDVVLDDAMLDKFRSLPGVTSVTPLIRVPVANATPQYKRVTILFGNLMGIESHAVDTLGWEVDSGSLHLNSREIILGGQLLDQAKDVRTGQPIVPPPDLQGKVIDLVVQKFDDNGALQERRLRLRVSAVLAQSGSERDFAMYISRAVADDIINWSTGHRPNYRRDGYTQVLVKVSDQQYTLQVQNAIMQEGFLAFSAQSMVEGVNQFFLVIKVVLGGVGGIALLVAGFGIANAMIMAIYERTREIGLMKAVGARNRDVLFIFLGEAASIGALGGAGGVLLSMGLGALINLLATSYFASQAAQNGVVDPNIPTLVNISPFLALFAVLFAAGVGLLAGIYPALRATRLSPIHALRYE